MPLKTRATRARFEERPCRRSPPQEPAPPLLIGEKKGRRGGGKKETMSDRELRETFGTALEDVENEVAKVGSGTASTSISRRRFSGRRRPKARRREAEK